MFLQRVFSKHQGAPQPHSLSYEGEEATLKLAKRLAHKMLKKFSLQCIKPPIIIGKATPKNEVAPNIFISSKTCLNVFYCVDSCQNCLKFFL